MSDKRIRSALISVYDKEGLNMIVTGLHKLGVKIYSTGGTYSFISSLGIPAMKVEDLTTYPSILGGRVKTLHPSVFGGILARRENRDDIQQLSEYKIPEIDLVIVDLYPFEDTVKSTSDDGEIIEKIDIGGISLIRAAAKNFADVVIIPGKSHYASLLSILNEKDGFTSLSERKYFAAAAFLTSSGYDTAIFKYFNKNQEITAFRESTDQIYNLRYGENPHQEGIFYGDPGELFDKLHGKELSYNNLLDVDAAINLINEFSTPTYVIVKHNNACGAASRKNASEAWEAALACDPVSAFGGVIAANEPVDEATASEIDKIFFEIIIAPGYSQKALEILKQKKNRMILLRKESSSRSDMFRSLLNGVLWQQKDTSTERVIDMTPVTLRAPEKHELEDLVFANILVKHSKSNAIVIAKGGQMCASGIGQTSRVDALRQAIEKAHSFGFDINGAVMASDAFFPFPDCVEIAHKAGITAVVQPGGSVRDKDSIDYCSSNGVAMVLTGKRHFKH
jgi:phosphoribosylaminoimidazolecarboxamide formyltransferase/IMP cyclohydrolase